MLQHRHVRLRDGLSTLRSRSALDRFHEHVLRTPREVRNALVYVLQNARNHRRAAVDVDAFSSGLWFDGWSEAIDVVGPAPGWFRKVVVDARSWLLTFGWRKHGLLAPGDAPAAARRP